jgi:hypothetical protein
MTTRKVTAIEEKVLAGAIELAMAQKARHGSRGKDGYDVAAERVRHWEGYLWAWGKALLKQRRAKGEKK